MNILAAFSVMLVLQAPQHGLLIDAARNNGGKTVSGLDVQEPKPTFDDVARASNLIVRGRVGHVTTRLSDDGDYVLSEFTIIPSKVYKGSAGDVVKTPGPTKPLIVRRIGGTVIVDGLQITMNANQYPETESLREGEDVLLFLNRNANTGNCGFTGGPRGAYRIADGKVTAMTKYTAEERGEEPQSFETFENRVLELIRK
jgi:hypothetical protein